MTTVLDICDEVAAALAPAAATRDDSRTRPPVYRASILYLWPRTDEYHPDGDGSMDLERFTLRLAWGVDTLQEHAGGDRTYATQVAIVTQADAFAVWVRHHRRGMTYEHMQAVVDYEGLSTHDVRGFVMDLSGYIIRSD